MAGLGRRLGLYRKSEKGTPYDEEWVCLLSISKAICVQWGTLRHKAYEPKDMEELALPGLQGASWYVAWMYTVHWRHTLILLQIQQYFFDYSPST